MVYRIPSDAELEEARKMELKAYFLELNQVRASMNYLTSKAKVLRLTGYSEAAETVADAFGTLASAVKKELERLEDRDLARRGEGQEVKAIVEK